MVSWSYITLRSLINDSSANKQPVCLILHGRAYPDKRVIIKIVLTSLK